MRRGSSVGSSQTRGPGRVQPQHRPGVGAVRGDRAAVFQHDVGEESFIPADEGAGDQGTGEAHRRTLDRAASEDKRMPNPDRRHADHRRRDPVGPHPRQPTCRTSPRRWPRKGIALREARVVPDVAAEIVAAVNALRARYNHVFTSGGIGPTHDDITADAVAAAFGVPIDVREDARAILASHYANPEGELNAARLRMARIPEGAALIDNPVSRAPGFSLGNVHVMAGVPAIFRAMLAGLLPRLTGGRPLLSRDGARRPPRGRDRRAAAARWPRRIPRCRSAAIRSTPAGRLGVNLVLRGEDAEALAAAAAALRALARRARARPDSRPTDRACIAVPRRRGCGRDLRAAIRASVEPTEPRGRAWHGLDIVNTLIFIGASLVVLGIFSSLIATRFGAPLLLVFLVVGMLAGRGRAGRDRLRQLRASPTSSARWRSR